jgi:drug/metabolite transporter (DMT)-like permease
VVRFVLAAATLLVLNAVLNRQRTTVRDLGKIAWLGVIGFFGYNILFFLALSLAPSADGSAIVPVIAPVITVAVTTLLGRRRLSVKTAIGLAAAVGGAAVFFVGIPAGGGNRWLGDVLFVVGGVSLAAYTMLGAPILARLPALTVTTYAITTGALGLTVVSIPTLDDVPWSELGSGFWLNEIYLAALVTALAYVMYYWAVRRVGPATASSALFLVPVFGVACSWLVLHESITLVQAVGSVLMLTGAWLATRPAKTADVRPVTATVG